MNDSAGDLQALVDALPEIYQPIYGRADLSGGASRATEDRFSEILSVYKKLEQRIGRPLRVLDLGCAQGFISLSLAAHGASVVGVEMLPQNVELCRKLAVDNPELKAEFVEGRIENFILTVEPGSFDLVLLLSVIHHVAFHESVDVAEETITRARQAAPVLLAELALADEQMYWASVLPSEPTRAFGKAAYVRELCRTGTHLSEVKRPLYFVSDSCWFAASEVDFFENVRCGGHRFAKSSFLKSRKYYMSNSKILKVFSLEGEDAAANLSEIEREAAFLRESFGRGSCPQLIGFEVSSGKGYLIRELVAGEMILDIIDSGRDVDRQVVIRDILVECIELEDRGLYHQDIRVWNVLRREDGRYCLIDFGAISANKSDCFWPENIYISFLTFIKELLRAPFVVAAPIREISVTPYAFSGHLSYWLADLAKVPLSSWSFKLMLEKLEAAFLDPGASTIEPQSANDALLGALEEAVSALARSHAELMAVIASNDLAMLEKVGRERQRVSDLHNDLLGISDDHSKLFSAIKNKGEEIAILSGDLKGQSDRLSAMEALMRGQAVALSTLADGFERHVAANRKLMQLMDESLFKLDKNLDEAKVEMAELHGQLMEEARSGKSRNAQFESELALIKARVFKKGLLAKIFSR